jgi:hypothetical protein
MAGQARASSNETTSDRNMMMLIEFVKASFATEFVENDHDECLLISFSVFESSGTALVQGRLSLGLIGGLYET